MLTLECPDEATAISKFQALKFVTKRYEKEAKQHVKTTLTSQV